MTKKTFAELITEIKKDTTDKYAKISINKFVNIIEILNGAHLNENKQLKENQDDLLEPIKAKIIILIDKQTKVNRILKLVNYNKTNSDLERLRKEIIELF